MGKYSIMEFGGVEDWDEQNAPVVLTDMDRIEALNEARELSRSNDLVYVVVYGTELPYRHPYGEPNEEGIARPDLHKMATGGVDRMAIRGGTFYRGEKVPPKLVTAINHMVFMDLYGD